MFRVPPASKHRDLGHNPKKNISSAESFVEVCRRGPYRATAIAKARRPTNPLVAVTLIFLPRQPCRARPAQSTKRNSRRAPRPREARDRDDTAEKTDAPAPKRFPRGQQCHQVDLAGIDVANAFTAPKVNPAAELFDANTMSKRNATRSSASTPSPPSSTASSQKVKAPNLSALFESKTNKNPNVPPV